MKNSSTNTTPKLTQDLLRMESVTPEDAGCQALIAHRLQRLGFDITHLRFGAVDNLWALRSGKTTETPQSNTQAPQSPLVVFAGHTDVVPTGPISDWLSHPFEPEIRDGFLYARGAADMKASLAAMIVATESFVDKYPGYSGSIAFLITSDEEGDALDGTQRVIEYLGEQNTRIDFCIVGEPSSNKQLGDTVRNGRRGSLSADLKIIGKQGHVAYPHLTINPIHQAMNALNELLSQNWAEADEYFPATSLQFSNINSGTGAGNVIPGTLTASFNFRFNPGQTVKQLKKITEDILSAHRLEYDIQWKAPGMPFITPPGTLTHAVETAISSACGIKTRLSTSGGTSDGRFIAPTGASVVEVGPVNATIHQIDECVKVDDLPLLVKIYFNILENLLVGQSDPGPA